MLLFIEQITLCLQGRILFQNSNKEYTKCEFFYILSALAGELVVWQEDPKAFW